MEAERTVRGYKRNLVVAATGTGKTVISALDYKRFRKQNPGKSCRLLFVAHREEILKQSMYTFRAVLKDANFGEMFVGSYKPESIDNLFISIQTFNSQSFTEKTAPDFYDYIIVDEFHHAAAPTYQKLLAYRYEQIDFIDEPVDLGFDCPLNLHCTYTRDQLLVAMDFMKPATVREGVKWLAEKKLDVFFVTLNKADKDYSPTTMYNDYSINESLFHWQSQSTTAENSATGQRYIHHRERDSKVLLFVREFKTNRITGGAEAYTYLGTANYVKHNGSRPMNITWNLDRPIPAKSLKKTNKLVVG